MLNAVLAVFQREISQREGQKKREFLGFLQFFEVKAPGELLV